MSAFVVSEEHIDALLRAGLKAGRPGSALRWMRPEPPQESDYERGQVWGETAVENAKARQRELTEATCNEVGRMLLMENVRSVNHRYNEESGEEYLTAVFPAERVLGVRQMGRSGAVRVIVAEVAPLSTSARCTPPLLPYSKRWKWRTQRSWTRTRETLVRGPSSRRSRLPPSVPQKEKLPMASESTPTPWRARETPSAGTLIEDASGNAIAQVLGRFGTSYPENAGVVAANADLIVRAVNSHQPMLDALRGMVQAARTLAMGAAVDARFFDDAEAAIALAEGREAVDA